MAKNISSGVGKDTSKDKAGRRSGEATVHRTAAVALLNINFAQSSLQQFRLRPLLHAHVRA